MNIEISISQLPQRREKRRPRIGEKPEIRPSVENTFSYIEAGYKNELTERDVDFLYEKLSEISKRRPASTTAEINSMQHYLYKLEHRTEEDNRIYKKAELLPLVLVDLLGRAFEGCEAHPASLYDDVINGVDLVVIDDLEVAGIALDATIQHDFDKTKMKNGVLEEKSKFDYLSDVITDRKLKKVSHVVSRYYNDASAAAVPLVISGTETDIAEYAELYKKLDAGQEVQFDQFPFLCIFIEQCTYQIDKLLEVLSETNMRENKDGILEMLEKEKEIYDAKKAKIQERFPRYHEIVKNHPNTISLKNTFDTKISATVNSMK